VCGSNLAGVTLLYIVLPGVVAVVSRPVWRMLVLRGLTAIVINEDYYYYYSRPSLTAVAEVGFVCLSSYLHDVSITDAATIINLDTEMFDHESWKLAVYRIPNFFGSGQMRIQHYSCLTLLT